MSCQLRVLATAAIGSLLLLSVSGCQYSYPFEISGVVRSPEGKPLSGVRVTFNAQNIRQSSFPVITGPDGTFKGQVRIADIEFMRDELPKWHLELSKESYEVGKVDVSPKQKPESSKKTTILTTDVTLKVR